MAVLFHLLGSGTDLRTVTRRDSHRHPRRHGARSVRRATPSTWPVDDGRDRRGRPDRSSGDARCSTPADASSRPGFVDLHAHLREPGREEAETIETGSRAAALGGLHRGGGDAEHRTGHRLAGRGRVRRELRRSGPRCATCTRRAASRSIATGKAAGSVRRAGRRRRAPVHRRRQRRAGPPPDAPRAGVRPCLDITLAQHCEVAALDEGVP